MESQKPLEPVSLVPCRQVSLETAHFLARSIREFTTLTVEVRDPWELPREAFHELRGQYHAGAVLEALEKTSAEENRRLVAVVAKDLFLPIFTHVYGEARLSGRVAVVSLYRLEAAEDGIVPTRRIIRERAAKVVIHELLHTFGLTHCRHAGCLMQPVTTIPGLDDLQIRLCRSCANLWRAIRAEMDRRPIVPGQA